MFHFAHAVYLGWSPVLRALLKSKRKSDPRFDENQDGARAQIIEEGVSGSGVAAPVAAKAADFYLRHKYGVPTDSIQTLREHYNFGVPARWAGQRRPD